jgi:hypothetical protein
MRKSYARHGVLSNGQHIGMYFSKHPIEDEKKCFVWSVGLCIDKSRRKCNDWYRKYWKTNIIRNTGRCGLEGLSQGLKWLKEHQEKMQPGDYINIKWKDEKRHSAYRYLLRLGFVEGNDGFGDCLFWRK